MASSGPVSPPSRPLFSEHGEADEHSLLPEFTVRGRPSATHCTIKRVTVSIRFHRTCSRMFVVFH
ncbi:hypothetical protein JB92DRAFT_2902689 [Gautieria morchelliformis]|nr:hypothetical protein JB92DRAFT_2902689 [Gautieria morchelliformis]